MGLFGSRKKTFVASTPYNMAGDINDRPNYLKTTVIGSIMNQNPYLGQSITNSYLNGPAIRFRNFARWARTSGYTDTVGLVTGSISVGNSVNVDLLRAQIPHASNQAVQVQSAQIGDGDYTYWADQWMLANHPEQINDDWRADIVGTTITIYFNDVATYSFEAVGFVAEGRYLYATYMLSNDPEAGPVVTGPTVDLVPGDPWPSVDGWTEISNTTVNTDVDLTTEVVTDVTYSDGRPAEHTETSSVRTETYQEIHRIHMKDEFMGDKPGTDSTYSVESTMYQDQVRDVTEAVTVTTVDEDIGGGVIRVTKTTTTKENLGEKRSYRVDTQETIQSSWSETQVFIYRRGTGNAILDAMFSPSTGNQDFFPFIPIRVDNEFLSDRNFPVIYEQSKKAFKKATNGSYDDTIEKIADNESLDDIDYAYVVFGVSLNVKEVACREYIYRFFQSILENASVGGDGEYTAWRIEWNAADASMTAWKKWKDAQGNPSDPLFGTPEPAMKTYPPMPDSEIKISSDKNAVMNYDIRIRWSSIIETEHVGLGKPDAKVGDVWFQVNADNGFNEQGYVGGVWGTMVSRVVNNIDLYWQDENNSYRKLNIRGLVHRNEIYNGKSVEIDAKEALEDIEESGFLIPLHEGVYRSMPLSKATQMATACSYIVFNSYQVVKKKWYQTGVFQVVLIVAVIVISVVTYGGGAAASGGLLGSNVAVGTALGLTGISALIVGAIANAVAAMLLVTIIQRGSVAIFGEKLGIIIGAIASVIALNVGTAMANGQTMAQGFGNMMKADNLLKLTNTGANAYSDYVNVSTRGILEETAQMMESYKVESAQIAQQYADTFGANRGVIDPLALTDSVRSMGYVPESADSFLSRTLLLGSEVADLSLEMLTNFTEMTLNTNLQT